MATQRWGREQRAHLSEQFQLFRADPTTGYSYNANQSTVVIIPYQNKKTIIHFLAWLLNEILFNKKTKFNVENRLIPLFPQLQFIYSKKYTIRIQSQLTQIAQYWAIDWLYSRICNRMIDR